jgi:MFS family permease
MTSETEAYHFAPNERPSLPGGPFIPHHSTARRATYLFVGLLIGVCTTLPNGLITANSGTLPGSLDEYIAQISWLPAIYVAMNASANLTLVKARAQFGIPQVTLVLLTLYALADVLQLLAPSLATAVVARAINGMMAGAMVSLSIYYLLQVFSPKTRPMALVVGLGLTQLGIPLARMIPLEFLASGHWRGLHLTELMVALVLITATLAAPLPPSERSKAFSPLDLLTIALLVPAFLLICGVLGLGRVFWWTDAPQLGWMLAAAIPLVAIAAAVETRRSNPLLQLRWFGGLTMLRFAAIACLVRLALVEQTYGSVGLLSANGQINDQLALLFGCVALAMLAGLVTACLTLSQKRLPFQVITAALIIALGAYLDSNATDLTRAPQLFLSQCLLGFGATLFIGPAMIYGFLRMSERGPAFFVTLAVLFSTTQNVGSLAGSALLGSFQIVESRAHAGSLADNVRGTSPAVIARITGGASSLNQTITDQTLSAQEGAKLLGQALGRQAAVLAFNDVFRLVAAISLLTAFYVLYLVCLSTILNKIHSVRKAAA